MAVKCPEGFVLMTEEYWLGKPVFDLVTSPDDSSTVAAINSSLNHLSAHVRLYYHLIWVYRKSIKENPDFKDAVYRVENFRRGIQTKIDEHDGQFGNEFRLELAKDANTVPYIGFRITEIYQQARNQCLSSEDAPYKLERLRKIYDILDAEQEYLADYPETKYIYGVSGENYYRAAFGKLNPADEEEVNRFRRRYLPQTYGTPTSTN
jgi:hypothetical protein